MGSSPPTRVIFSHVRCQLTSCIDRLGLSEVVLPAAFQEITVKARHTHTASSAADSHTQLPFARASHGFVTGHSQGDDWRRRESRITKADCTRQQGVATARFG
jgi:hypothetical protein